VREPHAGPTCDRSARDEERCGLQDLIFHVDERVFFQRDAPVGQPLGICFHRVAAPLPVRQILVLPEVHDPTHGSDMRDEESVGLSEIFALQRQRQSLVGFEKISKSVRFNVVCAMVEDLLLASSFT
jgi:hypothetical protein